MADKPHVLLLIDDEHRPDVMSVEGNPIIRMPTLDRCIEQGTYFRNAYTSAPVCVPARQSFLTGHYPRNNGCTGFATPLPSDVLTIPQHLRHYGYYAACAGKMHFVGPDQMHGWSERIGRDVSWAVDDSPLAHLAGEVDPVRRASSHTEPGTGLWPTVKEVRNARVVEYLDEVGVLDDFIVVFLSDHGEILGQKGLWHKLQFFDGAVRVPFSITAPGAGVAGGQILAQNVSLVDLFPTLCELVDVPVPEGLDGRSLLPLMRGDVNGWDNEVYSEMYQELNGPGEMVKVDQLKYFRFTERDWPDQLFDQNSDPLETHNLIDDPAYAEPLAKLRAKLDGWGSLR